MAYTLLKHIMKTPNKQYNSLPLEIVLHSQLSIVDNKFASITCVGGSSHTTPQDWSEFVAKQAAPATMSLNIHSG